MAQVNRFERTRIALLLLLLLLGLAGGWLTEYQRAITAQAQQALPANRGAIAVWQALQRLRTTVTVLATQAHPDDEDAALLTWLARGAGVRTGLLSLNRGEGGANLVGAEQYDALGVLRTEELLAATRIYGIDALFFTRAADFGFSKRLDETLEHWGKEVVLREMVRQLRSYRPDVIISRFHGTTRDGHGNHQAAGLLTREAFKLAADPTAFPEQSKEGLPVWQAKKLYLSVRANEPASLKIDVSASDRLLGRSYREAGAAGYQQHRSQAVGQAERIAAQPFSALQLVESTVGKGAETSIFDGLDTTIQGLGKLAGTAQFDRDLSTLQQHIEAAHSKFAAQATWNVVPDLVLAADVLRALIAKAKAAPNADAAAKDHLLFLLNQKALECNDAVNQALGLTLELLPEPEQGATTAPSATPSQTPRDRLQVVVPGQTFKLAYSVVNPSPLKLEKMEYLVQTPLGWETKATALPPFKTRQNQPQRFLFTLKAPDTATPTRLHWRRNSELRDHLYQYTRPDAQGLPMPPPELIGWFNYQINGVPFWFTQPAETTAGNRPEDQQQRRLLVVAPALSVTLNPRVGILPLPGQRTTSSLDTPANAPANTTAAFTVNVELLSNVTGTATGTVRLRLPEGWTAQPATQPFPLLRAGERAAFPFRVTPPSGMGETTASIQAVATYANREYTEGYQVIAHPGHEPRHLYRPATMEVRSVAVKLPADLRVGYVMGVGDEIPKALEQLGVNVTLLTAEDLARGDFAAFDAVLIGIRATAVRADLKAHYQRLLAYAENGGHLIYQYQTPEFDEAPYAPFPYKLTPRAEEVSEENSPVTILDAAHPFFNWPNKITPTDFQDWVEERGSKWLTTWDGRFQPLLETHDREQPPQKGGLLFARTGKGAFTYAAYAFYRQLPAGVPGAYRLFANLISWKRHAN